MLGGLVVDQLCQNMHLTIQHLSRSDTRVTLSGLEVDKFRGQEDLHECLWYGF